MAQQQLDSVNVLRAMARLMAEESDEPDDLRGLRARAVAAAADEIEGLRKTVADLKGKLERANDPTWATVDQDQR